jgi:hypothetical protein
MTDWLRSSALMIPTPPTHGPQGPLAPPYADLYASEWYRIRQDDEAGLLYVSGIIGNHGNISARRSVTVAVGITTYYFGAFRRTDERRTQVGKGLRPGDEEFTEPTVSPLRFRADGYEYNFEVKVDIFHVLADLTRANNSSKYEGYWAYPMDQANEDSGSFTLTAEDAQATHEG